MMTNKVSSIKKDSNGGPLISFGSFLLGIAIISAGYLLMSKYSEQGATGWRLYWPMATAILLAIIETLIAICSPGGSIFKFMKQLIID
jgi:hypothetical protein